MILSIFLTLSSSCFIFFTVDSSIHFCLFCLITLDGWMTDGNLLRCDCDGFNEAIKHAKLKSILLLLYRNQAAKRWQRNIYLTKMKMSSNNCEMGFSVRALPHVSFSSFKMVCLSPKINKKAKWSSIICNDWQTTPPLPLMKNSHLGTTRYIFLFSSSLLFVQS